MNTNFKRPTFLVLFLLVTTLTSCSTIEEYLIENLKDDNKSDGSIIKPIEKEPVAAGPSVEEKKFAEAENYNKLGQYDLALPIYLNLIGDDTGSQDDIHDKSLLRVAKIYERTDQSEKSILAFSELIKKQSSVSSRTSLQIALIKNHYRVSNYYQARNVKVEMDNDYRTQIIDLYTIFDALYYQSDLYFDRNILNELLFIGEIQKYFVYVIESDLSSESEKATDLLILNYKKFVSQLNNAILSRDIKRSLIVSLIDQLSKFDKYRMEGSASEQNQMKRFSQFASLTQNELTERLANGNF